MRDAMDDSAVAKKKVGRPKKYSTDAAKTRAYRLRATYMGKQGKRYDVYLSKEAHIAIMVLKGRNKSMSISAIFDAVILGTLKVPKTS
jgi:hypothetical protein